MQAADDDCRIVVKHTFLDLSPNQEIDVGRRGSVPWCIGLAGARRRSSVASADLRAASKETASTEEPEFDFGRSRSASSEVSSDVSDQSEADDAEFWQASPASRFDGGEADYTEFSHASHANRFSLPVFGSRRESFPGLGNRRDAADHETASAGQQPSFPPGLPAPWPPMSPLSMGMPASSPARPVAMPATSAPEAPFLPSAGAVPCGNPPPNAMLCYAWQWSLMHAYAAGAALNAPQQAAALSANRAAALMARNRLQVPTKVLPNPQFEQQVADVMAKLNLALMGSGYSDSVDIKKNDESYEIKILLPSGQEQHVKEQHEQEILSVAKQSLLWSAEQSSCVWVLGYKSGAFNSIAGGFEVTLAEMQDENRACWDIFERGTCSQGCSCRLQHPVSSIAATVEVSEAPEFEPAESE